MTDEAKALVRPIIGIEYRTPQEVFDIMCDRFAYQKALIETQAREIERLREALEAYAARCTICSGGGSIVEEDSATGALLWRDCPGCTPARAAIAGDSHD